jgi:hypothetical protein
LCLLQTKNSGYTVDANGTTQEEFEDIIAKAVQQAAILMPDAVFSWDKNKIQAGAELKRMGLAGNRVLPLSRYSPDMHKVIEHAIHQHKYIVHKQLLQPAGRQLIVREFQKLVKDSWFNIKQQGIEADVRSLPITYHIISTPKGVMSEGPDGRFYQGSGGDWPDKRFR